MKFTIEYLMSITRYEVVEIEADSDEEAIAKFDKIADDNPTELTEFFPHWLVRHDEGLEITIEEVEKKEQ